MTKSSYIINMTSVKLYHKKGEYLLAQYHFTALSMRGRSLVLYVHRNYFRGFEGDFSLLDKVCYNVLYQNASIQLHRLKKHATISILQEKEVHVSLIGSQILRITACPLNKGNYWRLN
jgi:hypothetical protein